MKMGRKSRGSGYTLDGSLMPRIRNYADRRINEVTTAPTGGKEMKRLSMKEALKDVDDVLDHLLLTVREYRRKPRNSFRRSIERTIREILMYDGDGISSRSGVKCVDKEERRLQAMEERHFNKRMDSNEVNGSDINNDASDDNDDDDGDDDGMSDVSVDIGNIDPDDLIPVHQDNNLMNRMLQLNYSVTNGSNITPVSEPPVTTDSVRDSTNSTPVNSNVKTDIVVTNNSEATKVVSPAVSTDTPIVIVPTSTSSTEKKTSSSRKRKNTEVARSDRSKRHKDSVNGSSGGVGSSYGSSGGFEVATPNLRYGDLGGIENILQDVRELIEYPLSHPEIYAHLGVQAPRGILLHGPPGCGKTALAHAVAGEAGVPFFKIAAPEVVSGMSGESEAKIRDLFSMAVERAPCIIFIDEIDAIAPKRENAQREMERRIVAQLLTCMDSLGADKKSSSNNGDDDFSSSSPSAPVLVIGATNRADAIDSALRRAGRFDREIALGIPDAAARKRILDVLCRKLRLGGDVQYNELAKRTPGYVGADLVALTKEAAVIAVNRIFKIMEEGIEEVMQSEGGHAKDEDEKSNCFTLALEQRTAASERLRAHVTPLTPEQLEPLSITMPDFEQALSKVQPSSQREGFATIPDVSWDDVGALDDVRDELRMCVLEPIRQPEKFIAIGLTSPIGVLLYGPPGCGKTLLAKAVARESGASFISIKGPELLNKYVGESERAIRQVFQRARTSSPCVVFFDELDALCPRRGGDSNSQASERLVNQLLTEMDGLEARKQVFVIAATNRPDIIDPAMLRPGRLDKMLYVPLPGPDARVAILRTVALRTPLESESVDLKSIGTGVRCDGFSGADLTSLVREASMAALKESLFSTTTTPIVAGRHFEVAFSKVLPSVSRKDERLYSQMQSRLRKARSRIADDPTEIGRTNNKCTPTDTSDAMNIN